MTVGSIFLHIHSTSNTSSRQKNQTAHKYTDQPAHSHSLISAFVIQLLDSNIHLHLLQTKLPFFYLVSVA